MVKNFIIEFDNHRKILTLSRQYLHKCIHTMAPLHSRKMKIKTYTLSTSLFCFSYNIFIQSIYDRQKGKNALGIFLVPLIHITEYLYDSWRRTLFIEHQIEVKSTH